MRELEMTEQMFLALKFLAGCSCASRRRIRTESGAGTNTMVALLGRGLVREKGSQVCITAEGRERLREEER